MNLPQLELHSVEALVAYERAAATRAPKDFSDAGTKFREFHIGLMNARGVALGDFNIQYELGSAALEGLYMELEQNGATLGALRGAIDGNKIEDVRYHAARLSASGRIHDISEAFRYLAQPKSDQPWIIGDM